MIRLDDKEQVGTFLKKVELYLHNIEELGGDEKAIQEAMEEFVKKEIPNGEMSFDVSAGKKASTSEHARRIALSCTSLEDGRSMSFTRGSFLDGSSYYEVSLNDGTISLDADTDRKKDGKFGPLQVSLGIMQSNGISVHATTYDYDKDDIFASRCGTISYSVPMRNGYHLELVDDSYFGPRISMYDKNGIIHGGWNEDVKKMPRELWGIYDKFRICRSERDIFIPVEFSRGDLQEIFNVININPRDGGAINARNFAIESAWDERAEQVFDEMQDDANRRTTRIKERRSNIHKSSSLRGLKEEADILREQVNKIDKSLNPNVEKEQDTRNDE